MTEWMDRMVYTRPGENHGYLPAWSPPVAAWEVNEAQVAKVKTRILARLARETGGLGPMMAAAHAL